jgi:hypothetical protein
VNRLVSGRSTPRSGCDSETDSRHGRPHLDRWEVRCAVSTSGSSGRRIHLTVSPSANLEEIANYAALVAEGAAAVGRHLDHFEFGAMLPIFPWDGTEVPAQARDGISHVYWQYARMADRGFTPLPSATPHPQDQARAAAAAEAMRTGSAEQLADIVAQAIRAVRAAIPAAKVHIVARSWWPGMPNDVLARSAKVFLGDVVPAALARC